MPKTPKPFPSQEQRTLQMQQQYIQLRKNGLSIKQIASKFDLPTQSVIDCHHKIYGNQPVSPTEPIPPTEPSSSTPKNTAVSSPKPQRLPRVDRSFNKQRNKTANACANGLHDLIGQNFTYLNQENQRLAKFKKEVSSWQK